jgi:hypothetical protein
LALLVKIIRQRLIEGRRAELAAEIAEARSAYRRGEVRRGTVADLMDDLYIRQLGQFPLKAKNYCVWSA